MPSRLHQPMPPLEGASRWINGPPPDIRGAPTLVHFWAASCPACKAQLHMLHHWAEDYGPRGLQLIGIHTRLLPTDDDDGAEVIAAENGLVHPIAVDPPDGTFAERFDVRYVPSYFIYDSSGRLRHYHSGYDALEPTERAIERVLAEHEGMLAGQH